MASSGSCAAARVRVVEFGDRPSVLPPRSGGRAPARPRAWLTVRTSGYPSPRWPLSADGRLALIMNRPCSACSDLVCALLAQALSLGAPVDPFTESFGHACCLGGERLLDANLAVRGVQLPVDSCRPRTACPNCDDSGERSRSGSTASPVRHRRLGQPMPARRVSGSTTRWLLKRPAHRMVTVDGRWR
jgi:hypothetical protein